MDLNKKYIDIDEARALVNTSLLSSISDLRTRAEKIDAGYGELWSTIEKLIGSGGKRFRPYISILMFQAFSSDPIDKIIKTVSAQELLHAAFLIHDDIIDRDYTRYGVDNISGQYSKIYSGKLEDESELRHFSDSAALLAGDLLLAKSYQMLLGNAPETNHRELTELYDEAIYLVVGGELMDVESTLRLERNANALNIAEYKTAHYSFVLPLMIGAILANTDDTTKDTVKTIGSSLGVAYQLVDDELGVFGDKNITGKSCDSDLSEGKKTYMIEQFEALASDEQKLEFAKYFNKRFINQDETDILRDLLVSSGARKANSDKISELVDLTLVSIDKLAIDDKSKHIFHKLVESTIKRSK